MGGVGPKLVHGLQSDSQGHRLSEKNVSYRTFSPSKQRPEAVLCYEEQLYDVYKECFGGLSIVVEAPHEPQKAR